ncbi:MAG: hypothetical protein R3C49_02935 [Planctomycetaceae bacterium]
MEDYSDGGVSRSLTVSVSDLQKMDQTQHEMVLRSGNGRSLFSVAAQTKGTQCGDEAAWEMSRSAEFV